MKHINNCNSSLGFLNGYGVFPYVIWRVSAGTYIQIPIANGHERTTKYLMAKTKKLKEQIEALIAKNCKLCLVFGANEAYYFANEIVTFSESIPWGGVLLSKDGAEMIIEGNHYKEITK